MKAIRIFLFIVSALILLMATTVGVAQGPVSRLPLVEPDVYKQLKASSDGKTYVIVMLRPSLAPPTRAIVLDVQEAVLLTLTPDEFELVYQYENFAGMTGRISASGLAKLERSPYVAAVGVDGRGEAQLNVSVPFINADDAQNLGYTGDGITVAVLDSGIDSDHADLSDDIASGWYHFLSGGANVGPGAEDDNGHGTNVSGIITSKGVVASIGVAPDADILAIKILDSSGSGYLSDWAAGVDYVVTHKDDYDNLCIINMSVGSSLLYSDCPCDNANVYNQALQASILAAKNAGIVTFTSSGNKGSCTSMSSPACLSAAFAVAAVYDQNLGREPNSGTYQSNFGSSFGDCYDATTAGDKITCFSNRLNNCNDLAAPGRLITAPGMGGGTSTYTGTSQASPHCAGVAAVMCDKFVGLTPDVLVLGMKNTGAATNDPCGTAPNPIRVDALAAVNALNETVYDNSKTYLGIKTMGGGEFGDQVALDHSYRVIVGLKIGVYNPPSPQYCDLKARIYKNDGPGGKPGTLLWASAWQNEWIPAEPTLINFVVPNILVPDTITWTLEYQNGSASLPWHGPATVGTQITAWWGVSGSWNEDISAIYMAHINAKQQSGAGDIPTLNTWGIILLIILLLSLGVWLNLRHRRHSATT